MKKKLAIALAVMLTLTAVSGLLTTTVFAQPTPPIDYPIYMEDGADVLDDAELSYFGNRVLGASGNGIVIPLLYDELDFWDGTSSYIPYDASLVPSLWSTAPYDLETMTGRFLDCAELVFENSGTRNLFTVHKVDHTSANDEAFILLEPVNIGIATGTVYLAYRYHDGSAWVTKRSKVYDISGAVVDPTVNKAITGLTGTNLSDLGVYLNDQSIAGDPFLDLDEIRTGSELRFRLDTEFFEWDPAITNMGSLVRKSTLDNNQVGLRVNIAKGYKLIEAAEIKNIDGKAWVVVEFADILTAVKGRDFKLTISLTYRGRRDTDTTVEICGTLANEEDEAYGEEDYAYLGDGMVLAAEGFVRNIELDLGNGVTIRRNLHEGTKYYGVATDERTAADLDIMDAFPTIKQVLNLYTVNLSNSRDDSVRIDPLRFTWEYHDGSPDSQALVYYVYDENGKYLGSTEDSLPYRDKYYFSTTIITVEIPDPAEEAEPAGEDAEESAADASAADNADAENE